MMQNTSSESGSALQHQCENLCPSSSMLRVRLTVFHLDPVGFSSRGGLGPVTLTSWSFSQESRRDSGDVCPMLRKTGNALGDGSDGSTKKIALPCYLAWSTGLVVLDILQNCHVVPLVPVLVALILPCLWVAM